MGNPTTTEPTGGKKSSAKRNNSSSPQAQQPAPQSGSQVRPLKVPKSLIEKLGKGRWEHFYNKRDREAITFLYRKHWTDAASGQTDHTPPDIEAIYKQFGTESVSQIDMETAARWGHENGLKITKQQGEGAETDDKLTELTAGALFAEERKGRYLYDPIRKIWREYNAKRGDWPEVIGTVRLDMAGLAGHQLRRTQPILNALQVAGWIMECWDWDAEEALAWAGGYYDRKTGKEHNKPSPAIRATNLVPAPAKKPSEERENYILHTVCQGAGDTLAARRKAATFLQAFLYMAFTGQAGRSEHGDFDLFLFLQGEPGGGKSSLQEALELAAGQYAETLTGEVVAGGKTAHRQWVAKMEGKRLGIVDELPDRRAAWKSDDMNKLTSGGNIAANRMHSNDRTFRYRGGIIVSGNKRPRAAHDSGIFRRMVLIEVPKIPREKRDKSFRGKLRKLAQDGYILRWILDGREAFESGVLDDIPAAWAAATREYRQEQDTVGQWLGDRCEVNLEDPTVYESIDELINSFRHFTDNDRYTKRWLGNELVQRGFERDRRGSPQVRVHLGLRLGEMD